MKRKITLTLISLLLSIGLFAQQQTYSLSVCAYIPTVVSTPFNNTVVMTVYSNGLVINTQIATMSGPPMVCFQSLSIPTNGFLPLNYTIDLAIDNCPVVSQSGVLSSNDSLNIPLTLCNSNCSATITPVFTALNITALQANATGVAPFTYLWSNGSTAQQVVNPTPGNYSVVIIDATGCSSTSANFNIPSNQNCSANITTTATSNTSYMLTASPTGTPPFSYAWNGGNPGLIDVTPSINVFNSGSYCLTIIDGAGCTATACDSIFIPNVACQTTITNTSATTFPGSLTASSTGVAPFSYYWSDINGNIQPSNSSTFFPSNNGVYCCTVTDATGCSNQACGVFNGIGNCSTAIVAITPPNVPPNTVVGLQAITVNGAGPYNYLWFLNGQLLPDTSMTITVSQSGIYSVQVVDGIGCFSTDSISMTLNATNCSANIGFVSNPIGGMTFTANSTGVAPFNYLWSTGSTSQSIVSTQAGSYSVTITDALGCVAIASVIDSVSSIPCTASINYSSPLLGMPTMLLATGTGVAPLSYNWTLNGVNIPSSNNPAVSPSQLGVYCVLITDANGCTSQACLSVTGNNNCQASISDSIVWNSHVLYAASTGIGPFTYYWSINSLPILNNNSSTFFAAQSGLYSVTIVDSLGCVATAIYNLNIPACIPSTSFGLSMNGATTITAGSSGVAPFTYSWTLNGLPFSTQQTITTTLNGNYCYIVTDANGCVATDCFYDTLSPQGNCSAFFTSVVDSLFLPYGNSVLIDFTAYPNGTPPFTYQWNFSDGTMSTVANPQHMFYTSMNMWHWADLTITDANGCVSNYSNSIILPIYPQNCIANFTSSSAYNPAMIGEVNFQNISINTDSTTTYLWSFGDGSSSTSQNPVHTFTVSGTYNISLTITTGNCVSTFTQNNYIDLNWWNTNPYSGNCSAGFVLVNAVGLPNMVYLVDISQVNNPFYTWNSSNGFMSNNPTPFFNLSGVGTYTICVTVTDTSNGCTDTFCDSLSIDSLGNVGRTPMNSFSASNASIGIAIIASPKSTSATSIADINKDLDFSIFPNPANSNVAINFNGNNSEVFTASIIDITGKVVVQQKLNNRNNSIDISEISNGSYFIRINSNSNSKTLKLIINH